MCDRSEHILHGMRSRDVFVVDRVVDLRKLCRRHLLSSIVIGLFDVCSRDIFVERSFGLYRLRKRVLHRIERVRLVLELCERSVLRQRSLVMSQMWVRVLFEYERCGSMLELLGGKVFSSVGDVFVGCDSHQYPCKSLCREDRIRVFRWCNVFSRRHRSDCEIVSLFSCLTAALWF